MKMNMNVKMRKMKMGKSSKLKSIFMAIEVCRILFLCMRLNFDWVLHVLWFSRSEINYCDIKFWLKYLFDSYIYETFFFFSFFLKMRRSHFVFYLGWSRALPKRTWKLIIMLSIDPSFKSKKLIWFTTVGVVL